MKRSLLKFLLLGGLLAFAGPAWSLSISGGTIDVGAKDDWYAESTQLNGEAAEQAWIKSILGEVTFVVKSDNLSSGAWEQTDEIGTWAFYLQDNPDFFLVKTGNNGTNDLRSFLFTNNDFKDWAVLDLDDIYVLSVPNIAKVSHISSYSLAAPVPEPGTLLLLGAGMAGLAAVRTFRKSV